MYLEYIYCRYGKYISYCLKKENLRVKRGFVNNYDRDISMY